MKTVSSFCNFLIPVLFLRNKLFFLLLISSAVNAQNNSIFYGGSGGGSSSVCFTLPIILPIELLQMEYTCQGDKAVMSWSTASETDTKDFIIESSRDGITWGTEATVPAASISSVVTNYSYELRPSLFSVYYRLILIDLNGESKILETVYVEGCGSQKFILFPNPSDGELNLIYDNINDNSRIIVQNIIGQNIREIILTDEGIVEIDLSELSPGNYIITIFEGANRIYSNRWVKT